MTQYHKLCGYVTFSTADIASLSHEAALRIACVPPPARVGLQ